jgi:hypothetical protein
MYCSRRDAICFRTEWQNNARIYACRKWELGAVPPSSKRREESMNVGKQLQSKVAPPCKKHERFDKSEYPKRILGKSDVYQMYDSVHKKESPIIMSHQQKRKTLPSFSDLVLEPEVW